MELQRSYEPTAWWLRKRVLVPAALLAMIAGVTATSDLGGSGDDRDGSVLAGGEALATLEGGPEEESEEAPQPTDAASSDTSTTSATSTTVTVSSVTTGSTGPSTSTTADPEAPESTTAPATSTTATDPPPSSAPSTSAPSTSVTTATTATTSELTETTTATMTTSGCHPAYTPCIPNLPGDALNCGDLSPAQKPVTVPDVAVDPYGLDSDSDGVGCEAG